MFYFVSAGLRRGIGISPELILHESGTDVAYIPDLSCLTSEGFHRRVKRCRKIGRIFDVGKFSVSDNAVNLLPALLFLISPPFSGENLRPIASAYGRWASGSARRP